MSTKRICDKCGKAITEKADLVRIEFEYKDASMTLSGTKNFFGDYHRKCFNKIFKTDLIKSLNIEETTNEGSTVTGAQDNSSTTKDI